MDATILPGPGVKARPPRARADGDRHSIQSVDRALLLLETIAEAGGEEHDILVGAGLHAKHLAGLHGGGQLRLDFGGLAVEHIVFGLAETGAATIA